MNDWHRMELSGVYFLASISILSVLVKEFTVVSEAKVGLAMVYTLQLTGACGELLSFIRSTATPLLEAATSTLYCIL
jgi:hypothetical protein